MLSWKNQHKYKAKGLNSLFAWQVKNTTYL